MPEISRLERAYCQGAPRRPCAAGEFATTMRGVVFDGLRIGPAVGRLAVRSFARRAGDEAAAR